MLHAMTFAAVLASCQTNGGAGEKSGIDLANLDSTYQPGADFYMYATGGWQKSHPLTDEYSRFGSFDILQENNNKQLPITTTISSISTTANTFVVARECISGNWAMVAKKTMASTC